MWQCHLPQRERRGGERVEFEMSEACERGRGHAGLLPRGGVQGGGMNYRVVRR